MPSSYPAMLRLAGRPVLVVGAGPVAVRKVESLLESGAAVTVVAPEVHPQLLGPLLGLQTDIAAILIKRVTLFCHRVEGVQPILF